MEEDEYKDTEIGRIPKDWEFKTIEEISYKVKAGGTPRRKELKYWNGAIPFVTISDITNSRIYIYKTKEKISELGLNNSSAWLVPPNSLLVSMYATIGETAINKIEVATNQAILAIIPKPCFNVEFGAYVIKYYKKFLYNKNIQSTQKNVNKAILKNFKIPFPPLEEQKRIAYVLSKIQNAIKIQDRIINSLQELKKSMLHKLFTEGIGHTEFKDTEIGKIPKDWEFKTIEEISYKVKAGGTPRRKELKYWNGAIPFVTISDITNSRIYIYKTKEKISELGLNNSSAWLVPPNSLLVSMYATIGETAINKIEVATNQAILAIIPKPCFNVEFGAYVIKYYKKFLYNKNIQSTQKNVNKAILKNFKIPFPPLEEQKRIADILSTIDNKISIEENRKKYFEALFKTMLNKLMTGQIRVKNLEMRE